MGFAFLHAIVFRFPLARAGILLHAAHHGLGLVASGHVARADPELGIFLLAANPRLGQ